MGKCLPSTNTLAETRQFDAGHLTESPPYTLFVAMGVSRVVQRQGRFKRAANARAVSPRLGATACRRASRKLAPRQDGASPWP